jgi:peptide chain release factor 3
MLCEPPLVLDTPSSSRGERVDVESIAAAPAVRELRNEVARRRTFAIISHPDAGKTTLTEKLLLYAGQVTEAGAVRGRKSQRAVTSDWMQIERERGISITSTVLSFPYCGRQLNLLDTPGHDDFSEDTYRTLTAADCAVMVLDAVKGIETQTRKLFKICSERQIPILTFVNKMDRPGCDPLGTLGEIEQVLGIHAVPLNWPIGSGREFCGVFDRRTRRVLRFQAAARGSVRVSTETSSLNDASPALIDAETANRLRDEAALLDEAGEAFDRTAFLAGRMTPVFFGSALSNFGVEAFLDAFLELAPSPTPRISDRGPIAPDSPHFSGLIFKIQANLDPRHHDRVAFLRVCAGRYTRDMEIVNARTGERIRIKRSQRVFARERETMEVAYPGDVVGLVIPGQFRLGDTLCEGERLHYQGQWQFAPECFATLRCSETLRRKQFDKGLRQLAEEGAIQLLHDPQAPSQEPVLAAVGQLQFDVVQYRLQTEYNAATTLHRLPFQMARWPTGARPDLEQIRIPSSSRLLHDRDGASVVVFASDAMRRYCEEMNPRLTFWEAPQVRSVVVDSRPVCTMSPARTPSPPAGVARDERPPARRL